MNLTYRFLINIFSSLDESDSKSIFLCCEKKNIFLFKELIKCRKSTLFFFLTAIEKLKNRTQKIEKALKKAQFISTLKNVKKIELFQMIHPDELNSVELLQRMRV